MPVMIGMVDVARAAKRRYFRHRRPQSRPSNAAWRRRRGTHTRFGSIYFWSLSVLFITSTGLAAMRWREDYYLFFLGALSFGVAVTGRTARRQRWKMPIDLHIVGMGVSYIAMLTAFYVDNGENLGPAGAPAPILTPIGSTPYALAHEDPCRRARAGRLVLDAAAAAAP
jgi:hypothetical protein